VKGLLVGGLLHQVLGLDIMSPGAGSPPWLKLDPRDYRPRRTPWVRQLILHTTKGIHPQYVRAGRGPNGRDKVVAEFWRKDPEHSGAHIVIDSDGSVACLADLATVCAYHATSSNDWSVGIEVYQEADGGIYEAALLALDLLAPAICEILAIPFQIPIDRYANAPIERMLDGGPGCVGVFGHRNNTSRRGRGDPGDEVYRRLIAVGAEGFDFGRKGDLSAWIGRQQHLRKLGEPVTVDGVAGPATMSALRKRGYANGRALDRAMGQPCP
jgi:hypothetical protein